jgi:ribose transport system ATP-binding protein
MSQVILEMKNINKAFGVPVLKDVNFSLQQGEVHALVGGNGAGKSTLMKIMTGVYKKDSGDILVNGEAVDFHTIHDANRKGIGMIFQEMSLVPTMTVAENIFLGEEIVKKGMRCTAEMNKKAKAVLQRLNIDIDPTVKVESLSVGLSQMVEIAKAISRDAKILVFDEPTASLSSQETEKLFEMIRDLKSKGVSMVYISHRMNEILSIADSITILRDGCVVFNGAAKGMTLNDIIRYMLGSSEAQNKFSWVDRQYDENGEDLLTVKNLKISDKENDISFSLKKGEILGFAGLMGSGRTEIVETLFGLRPKHGGEILLHGKQINISSSKQAVRAGFALIPEDRRKQGLVLIHSVKENAILPMISKLTKHGLVDEKKANRVVNENVKELNIRTEGINKRINLLSGGNQQKVVIGKWINVGADVMMLDEPTAGVDIGAKAEILDIVRKFADSGKGVIFISSELQELMATCDKIIVLKDGKITGELNRKDIQAEEELQYAIQQ